MIFYINRSYHRQYDVHVKFLSLDIILSSVCIIRLLDRTTAHEK